MINKNKELAEKYPFLEFNMDYTWSYLDDMPQGWKKAFGEQLCKELKETLESENALDDYKVEQVKEKYGELCWYDANPTSKSRQLINKYRELSRKTCFICGKPATYMSVGYVAPYCTECKEEKESKWNNAPFREIKN